MKLVLDANILFAAAVKGGATAELIFSKALELFAPEFIFEEFEKYRDLLAILVKKSRRSSEEFDIVVSILSEKIQSVPKEKFQELNSKVESISPDSKDMPYLALALKLGCAVWSNDKRLKEKQSEVKVFSTEELLEII